MELKYTRTGDYELPNLTLNDNKKGTINKYGMLRLDYLKTHKKALYTTLLMKDELTNHLISVGDIGTILIIFSSFLGVNSLIIFPVSSSIFS